ncbi:MAG TPA: AI-2E family transporter [Halieaceae bacterium]|jgi:putative permease|uniref:AI-2E family transporter n=1 Tax=Haliea sp. TaxID=1932666 RepID=UPI000C63B8EA|nr:AI-2E family transporter [Haliea sp.]HBQ41037.1 AI-2E family transporter [Halieaceae bacterium]MAD62801.1 AI-2E family transporter [Haliea sp.]MAY94343.1 AI-2E family transporter [Haliea sp.]MBP71037.1 AI-2E family transporter [Haliea sp.]HCD55635.1 AI-2E family transporter [Halieaceae bacterium]|tara:strand:+ start:1923 stop:2999 length:1077 start_codon:yes stop_codon:yes gene_type:complete
MLDIFNKWYKRYLFEEESVLLLVLMLLAVVLLATIGDILAPVVASIVLAYLMQGLAGRLERRGLPGWVGVSVAYTLFVGIFFGVTLGLLPLVWRQLVALAAEMPRMLEQGRELLVLLPGRYPDVVSQQQINQMVALAQAELGGLGQQLVTRSLATIPSILTLLVYMILIPILVFFFLKDRRQILAWLATFLPTERPLLRRIWSEMDTQVANYARGKVLEILIVGSVSYVSFTFLDLNYAALLALCVGLSVIIPYLGAALVTLPVLLVGFFQWGFTNEFYWLMAVYFVIQGLDGNVLVPLLFSEAVNLHPVAIILAVLFFGGIWGLWGVFFAIPLATLIKAVINAWPTPAEGDNQRSLE